jgi:hypothetical protein
MVGDPDGQKKEAHIYTHVNRTGIKRPREYRNELCIGRGGRISRIELAIQNLGFVLKNYKQKKEEECGCAKVGEITGG